MPTPTQNEWSRRTIIRNAAMASFVPLAGCNGMDSADKEASSDSQNGVEGYRTIRNGLDEMMGPWASTADEISAAMAEIMMETALHLAHGTAMPMNLPHNEFADIALAFSIAADLIQQGQRAFEREIYRSEAKAVYSGNQDFLDETYDRLPKADFDSEMPFYVIIESAIATLDEYIWDEIDDETLSSRMDYHYTILTTYWNGIERAKHNTASTWQAESGEVCISLEEGEEYCNDPTAEPFYNSLRFVYTTFNVLRG